METVKQEQEARRIRPWQLQLSIGVLAIGITIVLLLLIRADELRRTGGLPIGTPAPELRVANAQGDSVSLADFRGQAVLVIFASPRCGGCRRVFQVLKGFKPSEQSNLRALIVSSGTAEESGNLAKKYGFDLPVYTCDRRRSREAYRIPGVPYFYLIDDCGVVSKKKLGARRPNRTLAQMTASSWWGSLLAGIGR